MATQANAFGSFLPQRQPATQRRSSSRPQRVESRTAPARHSSFHRARTPNSGKNGEAQGEVVARLLPLVKRTALQMREHLPAHVDVDDLVGTGVLGLLDAVRKFDAGKRVKLESYARYRIRGAILDGLRSLDSASRDMRKKNKKVEKVYRELESQLGRPVTDPEMAEALGISLPKWYSIVQELQAVGINWLRPAWYVPPQAPVEECLVADDRENPFDLCYRREQRDLLNQAIARLPERERTIVSLYYTQDLTMKEIAERLDIDESRVSQLHSGALARLRMRVQAMIRPTRQFTPAVTAMAA